MPSAIPSKRSALADLAALSEYSRTYDKKGWQAKVKNAASACKHLKRPFLNYGRLFQRPQQLRCAELRPLSSFLHDLYSSTFGPFKYIAALRDPETVGACPYCGLSKNITVDHYLPRNPGAFPHFSFLSLNLVPSCSDCQGSKGSFYPQPPACERTPTKGRRNRLLLKRRAGENADVKKKRHCSASPPPSVRCHRGPTPLQTEPRPLPHETRRIIHPYFDKFLRRRVFDVDLEWIGGLPQIGRFVWKPHLTSAQRALVAFHLQKLNVKDRARGIVRRRYRAFAKVIMGRKLTQAQIETHLEIRLSTLEEDTGIANSIEARCLEALLRDPAAIANLVATSSMPKPSPLILTSTAMSRVEHQRRRREARDYIY